MARNVMTVMIALICLVLTACSSSTLNFKVRYDRVNGLKPEQPVLYENQVIGVIEAIEVGADGHYLVAVAVKPDYVEKVTVDSEFFIIRQPNQPEQYAIELVSVGASTQLVQDGAIIQGMQVSTKTDAFVDNLKKGLDQGLGGLSQQLDMFSKQLKNLPDTKEFKEFEKELRHFSQEMNKAGEDIQQKMQRDVMPELQKHFETLQKQLQGLETQPKPTPKSQPAPGPEQEPLLEV